MGVAFTSTPGEMPNSDIVFGYVRNNDSVAFVHDFYAVVRQGGGEAGAARAAARLRSRAGQAEFPVALHASPEYISFDT